MHMRRECFVHQGESFGSSRVRVLSIRGEFCASGVRVVCTKGESCVHQG